MLKLLSLSLLIILSGCTASSSNDLKNAISSTKSSGSMTTLSGNMSDTTLSFSQLSNVPSKITSSGEAQVPPPIPKIDLSQMFSVVRGTEPFWLIQFTTTGAIYSYTDLATASPIDLYYTHAVTLSGATMIIWGSPLSSGPVWQLTLTPDTGCQDGMSETAYTHSAILNLSNGSYQGCAN